MSPTFRRIAAVDVMPGQYIARARSHPFALVTATERLAVSTRIYLYGGWTDFIRPRHDALLWVREGDEPRGGCRVL